MNPAGDGATRSESWSGAAHNYIVAVIGVATIGYGGFLGARGEWAPAALVAAAGVAVLGVSAVAVATDDRFVHVRYGFWRWPHQRIPLARVAEASVREIRPMSWGYRGSLRIFRRAAVIVRGGPALSLRLLDGRVFAVTVDDAAGAAEAVNATVATPRS